MNPPDGTNHPATNRIRLEIPSREVVTSRTGLLVETDLAGQVLSVFDGEKPWPGIPDGPGFRGTDLGALVVAEQRAVFREFCARVTGGGPQGPDLFRLRRDGMTPLPVRILASPLFGIDGRTVRGLRAVFTDVSTEPR